MVVTIKWNFDDGGEQGWSRWWLKSEKRSELSPMDWSHHQLEMEKRGQIGDLNYENF